MQPLAGRSIWFVGIGGAGMSALASVCRAWGARVGGSDRARTPYAELLEAQGIPVTVGHAAANVPSGWEVVASSAVATDNPELAGGFRRRGELLAELVALRPSVVVAGAHGKTTTTAMIAFVLDRLGLDPTFLVGGTVAQLGGNARAGEGWIVTEGDESDRSLALLSPRVAVITNVDLDHHTTFASLAELQRFYSAWLGSLDEAAAVLHGETLAAPDGLELAVPGEHNRLNATCALAALEAIGVAADDARAALAEFRGVGRRFEEHGEPGGVVLVDDYAHHPSELAAAVAAARERVAGGRVVVLFQPHLYSRTLHLVHEFGAALATADAVCVTEIYAAREEPVSGVTGKLIVDAVAEARPGMPLAWAPTLGEAAAIVAEWARPGDLVLTAGAGDVDSALPLLRERLAA